MELPADATKLIETLLGGVNAHQLKRARLQVEHGDYSDEVKQAVLAAIDGAASDSEALPLSEAIKQPGVEDFIQSRVDEAVEAAKAENEALKGDLDKVKDALKQKVIDGIVVKATVLRKSEIDLQDVETSQTKYRESLSEMKDEELTALDETLFKEVNKLGLDPSETVDDDTIDGSDTNLTEGGAEDTDATKGKDTGDGAKPIQSIGDAISSILSPAKVKPKK